MSEKTLNERLTISVNGQEREFFMSFGLLNHLAAVIGDPENLSMMLVDPGLRVQVLELILAERDSAGKIIKSDLVNFQLSEDDSIKILEWALEHSMAFFIKTLKATAAVAEKYQGQMKDLMSLVAGSQSSLSQTPAA